MYLLNFHQNTEKLYVNIYIAGIITYQVKRKENIISACKITFYLFLRAFSLLWGNAMFCIKYSEVQTDGTVEY